MSIPQLNESPHLETANQTLCGTLSLLFALLLTELEQAVARSGGKALAAEFERRMNQYAEQHGWSVLTGLAHLSDVRECVPDVDARMLSSVYVSYAQYARKLAWQILGEQMLAST
ncbi:MAG TPA: hypothetical protein VMP08_26675, partial [Anaerolineae bacterium]|nr:hypothetical protein [Anaerolineae bacterium]